MSDDLNGESGEVEADVDSSAIVQHATSGGVVSLMVQDDTNSLHLSARAHLIQPFFQLLHACITSVKCTPYVHTSCPHTHLARTACLLFSYYPPPPPQDPPRDYGGYVNT